MLPSVKQLCLSHNSWLLQQHNNAKHTLDLRTSRSTKEWVRKKLKCGLLSLDQKALEFHKMVCYKVFTHDILICFII